jgi:hypothetical protein
MKLAIIIVAVVRPASYRRPATDTIDTAFLRRIS